MKKCKTIFLFLFFLFSISLSAQSYKWKSYRAYQYASAVEVTPNYVFGVYNGALKWDNTLDKDGSLLRYSPDDDEVKTFSLEDGLHDSNIVLMKYHPTMKCLVIIYQETGIDLFYGQNDITYFGDIKNTTLSNKAIKNIDFIDDCAYISGTFGAVILDLNKREIRTDFKEWGIEIRSFCFKDGYIYAATTDGLLKANPKSNLKDKANWEHQVLSFDKDKEINQLLVFNNQLILTTTDKSAWVLNTNSDIKKIDNSIKKIRILNDQLVLVQNNQITFYSDLTTKTIIPLSVEDISSSKKDIYWLANKEKGLTKITKNGNDHEIEISGIKVNSPLRNYVFHMNIVNNKLLVTGGERWGGRGNKTGTFMIYENNTWDNMDDRKMTDAIRAQLGKSNVRCTDLVSAAEDPRDPNHYFVSSFGEGVYELRRKNHEFEFIKLHTITNTNNILQSSLPGDSNPDTYVRIDGLFFDKNNNLYMTNVELPQLAVLKNNNTWLSLPIPDLDKRWTSRLVMTQDNILWGNVFRATKSGIYMYNTNNTLDNINDDQFYYAESLYDQTGRSFKANEYLCLAKDQNGVVWVGTNNGPIYFSSITQLKDDRCNRLIETDYNGDGYYVLDGVKITTIAIDGANRKWMGSEGNGLFMVDQSDGKIVVKNFNTSNSYILSNKITSITADQQSGEIFIGTDMGLCSYQSDAIEGKPDYSNVYAYPNPVYPSRNSEVVVTGLMSNSTVKITDIAGNLIQEATSIGGQYTWHCKDINGDEVKAGIYLVFATASDGSEGVVTKIMVIR